MSNYFLGACTRSVGIPSNTNYCSQFARPTYLSLARYMNSSRAAQAEKRGGATSMFGRASWKSRFFVIDKSRKGLAYFGKQTDAAPLKPPIKLEEYSVVYTDYPQGGFYEVSRHRRRRRCRRY